MISFRRRKTEVGLDTNRLEAFSDGVFAIAITILVLGLTVPELSDSQLTNGELTAEIIALWPKLLSYIISFLVIGIFWVGHHTMFHYIKRADRNFIWLNTLFLMVMAFFPFPVALIGQYSLQEISIMVYGLTLVIAGLLFGSMWHYASSGHRLINKSLPEHIIKLGRKVVFMAPAVYIIALVLFFVNPIITLVIYILVPIVYVIPSPIDELIEFQEK